MTSVDRSVQQTLFSTLNCRVQLRYLSGVCLRTPIPVRSSGVSYVSPAVKWKQGRRCLVSTSATQTSLISRPTICKPRRQPAAVRTNATSRPRGNSSSLSSSRWMNAVVRMPPLYLSPRSVKGAISRDKNPRLVSSRLLSSLLLSSPLAATHPVVSRVVSARAGDAIEIVTDDVRKTI